MFDFLRQALPTTRTLWLVGPASVAFTTLIGWAVGRLRVRREIETPYTRKIFHFVIFTAAGVVQLAWGLPGTVVYGGAASLVVLAVVARGDGLPFYEALARPSDRPHRTLFIVVPMATTALGGVLANVLVGPYAMVGYWVAGWGDAAGEPVGTRWGRHPYRVPSLAGVPARRTLEGSAAVAVVAWLAAWAALVALGHGVLEGMGPAAGVAVASAAVEAVSNHGIDNLTIQVAASGVAWLLLA